jgi:hypothetical protein
LPACCSIFNLESPATEHPFFIHLKIAVEMPPVFAILLFLHPTDQGGYEEEKKVT